MTPHPFKWRDLLAPQPKPQLQITAGTELDVLTLRLCTSGRRRPIGSSYGTASDSFCGCWTRLLANMDNKFTSTSYTSPNSTCWLSHWESSPSIFGLWAPMVPASRHCSLGPAKSAPLTQCRWRMIWWQTQRQTKDTCCLKMLARLQEAVLTISSNRTWSTTHGMPTTRRPCGSSQCLDSLTSSFRSFPTFSLDLPTTTLWKTDLLTKDTRTTSMGVMRQDSMCMATSALPSKVQR